MSSAKGEILAVGTFDEHGSPVGWVIRGADVGLDIDLENLENTRFGGYTIRELREIYDRGRDQ